MKTKKALINQWLLAKEARPFKQGVRGSNPRWSTKEERRSKRPSFFFSDFCTRTPDTIAKSAVAASGGEPIANSNQSFSRAARQKPGFESPLEHQHKMRKNLVVPMTTRFFHVYAALLKTTLWSPINGAKTGGPRCFGVPFRAQMNYELNLIKKKE